MRRLTYLNVLTLTACLSVAVTLGLGCDTRKATPSDNSNKNANTAKSTTTDDTDTSMTDDADSHEGHDHGDDAHDHGGDAGDMSPAGVDENGLADLSMLKIERRPSGIKPTNRRDATGDMIYATVRVQMDILLADRKALLDAGHDVTDPEVRKKEESIRKAIALLAENGETIEPIDPPIEGLILPTDDASASTTGM